MSNTTWHELRVNSFVRLYAASGSCGGCFGFRSTVLATPHFGFNCLNLRGGKNRVPANILSWVLWQVCVVKSLPRDANFLGCGA